MASSADRGGGVETSALRVWICSALIATAAAACSWNRQLYLAGIPGSKVPFA
jgi:hypothetical protein